MQNKPKYQQIMDDLESQIQSGMLVAGDQIPTEKQLCDTYHTSRMTVNKAIMMLCEKKLIDRIAGKGSFVRNYKMIKKLQLGSNDSFSSDMRSIGKKPGAKLIKYELLRGKDVPEVKEALQLNDDDFIHYFIRLRTGDNMPIAVSYTYLSGTIFPSLDINVLEGSLYQFIEKQGFHIKGLDGEYSAVMPTEEQKKLLEIGDVALFKCHHVTYLTTDQPFEYISTYYIGDKYSYSLKTF